MTTANVKEDQKRTCPMGLVNMLNLSPPRQKENKTLFNSAIGLTGPLTRPNYQHFTKLYYSYISSSPRKTKL